MALRWQFKDHTDGEVTYSIPARFHTIYGSGHYTLLDHGRTAGRFPSEA